jgi:xanthine/uracil permease
MGRIRSVFGNWLVFGFGLILAVYGGRVLVSIVLSGVLAERLPDTIISAVILGCGLWCAIGARRNLSSRVEGQ